MLKGKGTGFIWTLYLGGEVGIRKCFGKSGKGFFLGIFFLVE
jgi:hypothetical protein